MMKLQNVWFIIILYILYDTFYTIDNNALTLNFSNKKSLSNTIFVDLLTKRRPFYGTRTNKILHGGRLLQFAGGCQSRADRWSVNL